MLTLKQRIVALSIARPDFTMAEAAHALGCAIGSVRGYTSELRLCWTPAVRRRRELEAARLRRVERIKANTGAAA